MEHSQILTHVSLPLCKEFPGLRHMQEQHRMSRRRSLMRLHGGAGVELSSERPAQSLSQSGAQSLAYSAGGSLASMGSLASLSHAQAKRELIEEMMQMLRTERSLGASQAPSALPPSSVAPEQGSLATADSLPTRGVPQEGRTPYAHPISLDVAGTDVNIHSLI